jgi:GxxExxY protein
VVLGLPITRPTSLLTKMRLDLNYKEEEGYALVGAAFEVFKILKGGLSEEIYQESLEWELGLRGIPYCSKAELFVNYKGHTLEKKYIPDLLVFDSIIAELKAVKSITAEHEKQLINYMHITQTAIGYLINFEPSKVEWKRFILRQYIPVSN